MKHDDKGKFAKGNEGKPIGATSAKTKQWEALGDFITQQGAERAMQVLNTLNNDDFLEQYNKLLNYFKPRLASTNIDANIKSTPTIQYKNVSTQFPENDM
jgi:hypothetical protein